MLITAFQVVTIVAALARDRFPRPRPDRMVLRGGYLHGGMYGAAETLASRIPNQEEYIARVPAVAIVPWFLAGSLFPISAPPSFLTWVVRVLPLTHALALMRYASEPVRLHDIWGMSSTTTMASLSLRRRGLAAVMSFVAARVFSRRRYGEPARPCGGTSRRRAANTLTITIIQMIDWKTGFATGPTPSISARVSA
jgi:hypothetical protein